MHIMLISLCQKRAAKRTRTLLDRYATRSGPGTWMTPITQEALDELHRALRQMATRNTAVACYRNEGTQRMGLLWVVGRQQGFGLEGAMPVASTRGHVKRQTSPWVRSVSLIAHVAGLAHDLGKASVHFQDKLQKAVDEPISSPIKDRTRHEWTSLKVFQQLRQLNFDWDEAWLKAIQDPNRHLFTLGAAKTPAGAGRSLATPMECVDFAVLTHHGMLGGPATPKADAGSPPANKGTSYVPGPSDHTQRANGQGDDSTLLAAAHPLAEALLKDLRHQTARVSSKFEYPIDEKMAKLVAWGHTLIARSALILADHEVSSKHYQDVAASKQYHQASPLKANTTTVDGKPALNQPLEWHLSEVGRRAQSWVHRFAHPELPGISPATRKIIQQRSGPGRFEWQDRAADHLASSVVSKPGPVLVFNVAGTGAGKTRMNLRALDALTPPNRPLRVAAGFNLRTLTLQTHDAFRHQMKVGSDELACVIGDNLARAVHELNTDENDTDLDALRYDVVSGGIERPQWLQDLGLADTHLDALIASPILVSTMDYLVNAGEPHRQAHHGHALFRVSSSDLILDEVDSYDPESIVAVLRVVMVAAMFGRNVIASSATLAIPLATALYEAFAAGTRIHQAFQGERTTRPPHICFIDHLTEASSNWPEDKQTFCALYQAHQHRLINEIRTQPLVRLGYIQPVGTIDPTSPRRALHQATVAAMKRLHEAHRWVYDEENHPGKRVSFGVIRVAHVMECVALAEHLGRQTGMEVHVCPYHAGDFKLRRAMKEKHLDHLFNRTRTVEDPSGNRSLRDDPDIRRRVDEAKGRDILFILVATPVEEVGRDHDFDWGIIEPSSVHSIVQMAGRINRHRLVQVSEANLAILDINYKEVRRCAGSSTKAVFQHPGHESDGQPYMLETGKGYAHTMNLLLNPSNDVFPIDARLRFGDGDSLCLFAKLDDAAIVSRLKEPMAILLLQAPREQAWMCKSYYRAYPLRARSQKRRWRAVFQHERIELEEAYLHTVGKKTLESWKPSALSLEPGGQVDWWLSPDLREVLRYAQQHQLSLDKSFELELGGSKDEDEAAFVIHARLGGCRRPRSPSSKVG